MEIKHKAVKGCSIKVILSQHSFKMHSFKMYCFTSGHVITGMAAGYDNQNIMGMDNLFATTISGDLGHSGLVNNRGVCVCILKLFG